MSSVDNRVVEMQFNNAQFERGISQSTSSLDRLKNALHFDNTSKGFDQINQSANKVDLSFLEKRFSTFGIVGMTAVQNITNRLMDLAFKIKGIFTRSLVQGGITRALNIEQAKFQIEGLNGVWDKTSKGYTEGMKTIRDATLEAVKGTAYGLDEAAKVGSQLLATGIKDADELQTHMRSVAGVAAMTGSSYGEIGRIFTQTAGQGNMMGQQLQELSARGLNAASTLTDYFSKHKKAWEEAKSVLSDKDLEKLGKLNKPTEAAVREIASKRGITFKMFSDAMDEAFGAHAKDANKTYTGALSNMKAALSRIGADIAGDSLTNLRDIFNSLTPVIDSIHDALGPFIEDLNNVQKAATGKIVNFLNELNKAFTDIRTDPFEFTMFDAATSAFYGLISAVKMVGQSFGVLLSFLKPIGGEFLRIIGYIGNYLRYLGLVADHNKLFQSASKVAEEWGKKVAGAIHNLSDGIGPVLQKLLGVLPSIGKVFSSSLGKAIEIGTEFGNFIANILKGVAAGIPEVVKILGKGFGSITDSINKLSSDGARLTDFFSAAGITIIVNNLTGLAKSLKSPGKMLENFLFTMKNSSGPFYTAMIKVKEGLLQLEGAIKADIIIKIAKSIGIMAASLFVLSSIPADKMVTALSGLAGVSFIFGSLMKSLGALELFSKGGWMQVASITALAGAIDGIATALLVLTGAVKILGGMDLDDLAKGLVGVGILMAGVVAMSKALAKEKPDKFMKGTTGILMIAIAIDVMAKAVGSLGKLNLKDLAKGLGAVIVLMGVISGMSHITGSMSPMTGVAMLAIAEAINILYKSASGFAKMDVDSLKKGIGSVVGIMLSLAGISRLMGNGAGILVASVGILIISGAMKQLVSVVKQFGGMDIGSLAKGIGTLVGALLGMALVGKLANGTLKGAVAIEIMSIAVRGFADALVLVSKIPTEALIKSIAGLALGLLAVGGAAALLGTFAAGPILIFSGAVAILGAGLLAAGIGVSAFAAGIATLVALGGAGLTMLGGAIETFISYIPQLAIAVAVGIVHMVNVLEENIPKFVEFGLKMVLSILEGISSNIGKIVELGSEIIIKFLSGVSAHIYQVATIAVDIMTKFIDAIANRMDSIVDTGMNLIAKFVNGMANGLREHGPELIAAFKNLWGAIMEFAVTILQEIVELIPGIGPGLASALEGVKAEIRKATAPEDMKKMSEEQIKAYGSGMDAGKQDVIKGAKKVTGVAKKHIGSKSSFDRAGRSDTSAYAGGIGSGKGVDKAARRLKKSAVNGVSGSKEFGTQGDKGGSAYGGGIGKHDKKAAAEAKKLKSKATSSISGTAKDFSKEGDNAGSGFVAGLKAWIGRAFSAGKSVTSSGVRGAKAGHNSHSPSKKMIEQGKFFVMGYVLGIRRYENKALKEGKSLTASTVDTVKDSLKAAHSILESGIDVNPTIRPVMDTSDIERGASYIDNILGKNTAYSASVFGSIDDGANAKDQKILGLTEGFDNLSKRLNQVTDTMNNRELNAYITVNGSENPEDFADRFLRQMKLNMRA